MNNRVVRNAGWIIGAKVFQMFLGLFISAWMARYLGPSNLGQITYVASFVSFFSSLATLGLNSVIIKELIDHDDRQHYVLGTSIIMRLASSFLSALCVLGIITVLNPGDRLMTWITLLLSLSLIFESFEMFNYWYQSKLQSKVTSIIQTVTYVIVAAWRLTGLILNRDVLWFAFATSLESISIAVMLYLSYRKRRQYPLAWDSSLAKEMLSKSHHFIYSGLMVAIYSQMDSIMLKEFIDAGATGYYSTATGINTMWSFILVAIIDSIYPTIVEAKKSGDEDQYHHRIIQLYSIVFWLSSLASIAIMIIARPLVLTLYGAEYIPSIGCLRIVTWINTFAYLGVARGAWMVCENNQVYQKYILGIGAAVNVVLNALWIPLFGIAGASFATLVTQVVTSMIAPLLFTRTRENTLFILKGMNPAVFFRVISSLIAGRRQNG